MRRIIDWVGSHVWETTTGVLAVALVGSLVALATTGSEPEPEATPETTTTTVVEEPVETTIPDGDPVVTTTAPPPEGAQEGITAVVVDNVADVGFQVGIDSADLLIETPVEGGLTRFTALYGGTLPDLVGPVRSLRPVSADLLAPFSPVVFATGGQRFVTGGVEAVGASIISPADSIAYQSLERPQPYHLFVSPGFEVLDGQGLAAPWAEGAWSGGDAASEVTLPISGGVTWRFEDGTYVRYRNGGAHEVQPSLDADPVPLSRDSLVLLVAHQKSAGYTDTAGADVPTFDVIGSGDVYVFHGGEVAEGTWLRANQSEDYLFTDSTGQLITIPSGRLYLAIVPAGLDMGVVR